MSQKKGYIDKISSEDTLYETLHLEALEIVQKLSGEVWTDYNEHDPGVTVIENLAYALTEVMNKTTVPLSDLLIKKDEKALKSGDNALFEASDILTTGPVTFNDYRRMWIDGVSNVKNVWIHNLNGNKQGFMSPTGLFKVLVEKYEYRNSEADEKEENERIREAFRKIYHENRNLCEDLYSIEVCKPLVLQLKLSITVNKNVLSEYVLAEIIRSINQYLAPDINYCSLQELLQQGYDVNTIFNGPRLTNGFILEDELKDPIDQIVISDLIRMISMIPGIVTISKLDLSYNIPGTDRLACIGESFKLPRHTIAMVDFPKTTKDILFSNSEVSFTPDLFIARKHLVFLNALNFGSFKEASSALNGIQIPSGTSRDIMSYLPLRKQFPEVYMIDDLTYVEGMPSLRQAQIRQLKAYLMPFDQIMVNYLSQLDNISTLFSIKDQRDPSYFYAPLPDVEQLADLVTNNTISDLKKESIPEIWNQILKSLNNRFDDHAMERYNSIANHLLSRFSEQFYTYALGKIDRAVYGDGHTSDEVSTGFLAEKRAFLRAYASMSYARARAFNYHKISEALSDKLPEEQTAYLPGAFRKLAVFMGIEDYAVKSLTRVIEESQLSIEAEKEQLQIKIEDVIIRSEDGEVTEIEEIEIREEIVENLFEGIHFTGHHDTILKDILARGILQENYEIKKLKGRHRYAVLFKGIKGRWNIIHISDSPVKAQEVINETIVFLTELSCKSEGFYVVEHLLLLPDYKESHFGFSLNISSDPSTIRSMFKHKALCSLKDRNETIGKLKKLLISGKVAYQIEKIENVYEIKILSGKQKVLAVSEKRYPDRESAQQQIQLLESLNGSIDENLFAKMIRCDVFMERHRLHEVFFDYRLSIVAPSWPARFQDTNFRSMFENMILEQLPIHLAADIFWLDFPQMKKFETLFFDWFNCFVQGNKKSSCTAEKYALVDFVKNLTNENGDY